MNNLMQYIKELLEKKERTSSKKATNVIDAEAVFLTRISIIEAKRTAKLSHTYRELWDDDDDKESLEAAYEYAKQNNYWHNVCHINFNKIDPRWKSVIDRLVKKVETETVNIICRDGKMATQLVDSK